MSEPRDPHLLAALRHAPDRDALPPPELSARILAAARDAVRPPPAASPWSRFANWLVQPQVGAALATLALATLLGVMWSTHEPPEPTSAPAPAPTPSASDRVAAPTPSADALPVVPAMPLAPPATEPRAAAKAEHRQAQAREASAKAVADLPPTPTPSAAPPPRTEAAAAKADALPPAATPPSMPPPAMATAPALRARGERAATSELGALAAKPSAAQSTFVDQMAERSVDALLARIDRLLSPWPEHVTWSSGSRVRAHDAAQADWWTGFKRETTGKWAPQPRVRVPDPPWLRLSIGTAVKIADFHLTGDAVLMCGDEVAMCWRAPISADQARDWQQAVGSW